MYNKKFFFFFFLMISSSIVSNAQCAMCKAVLETGDLGMAEGVNNGISYLMVFPYLLIFGLFFTLYRYKKNQVKN
ncbi:MULTISPECIES: hypothetical protein [unclassified Polaribacter]|uniref:hypothetical protein n=1 Tax=unclassified Polaribacter TaxID=196858 RepID=UPI0011BE8E1E|nr:MULTISPECIES: hypothetical protein [unclassified Polaribacter]TXD54082.1 hypothetical protein ES043_02165 [Polaribacter sp. IC063]TXD62598.1 hypothetical protein ES044_01195 [Polaribacter sp. IC066]